jgi:hypothetical protein
MYEYIYAPYRDVVLCPINQYWTHSICQEDPCDSLMGILLGILVLNGRLGDEEIYKMLRSVIAFKRYSYTPGSIVVRYLIWKP